MPKSVPNQPLDNLDQWEDDLLRRYPEGSSALRESQKSATEFRNYESDTRPGVREFYRLNHRFQTHAFVTEKRREYLSLQKRTMGIWEAMEFLNTLVDESDPDTDLSQIEHLMQTAESIRADGHPRWFILTGLIHDLGKILCLFGEPQWAVVGDTFPVGCAFSDKVVLHEFFDDNPDRTDPRFSTHLGIYAAGAGLDNVLMSWGHDEYLYHVVKSFLPEEALYMIRYHSFYAAHREGAYDELMNDHDRAMFAWVRKFNPYDLYTKGHQRPDVDRLRPYYEELIAEFFPTELRW
ncbi:inositol oxygenase [Roseiconus nitratireducens]|uniref:Inositol oxygenase n=1 Tax=Roseiconus nitratireducens TaxID=2605748 RepID=A0A5M6D6Y3_9BACT|nr:inositol oxygenase family protein [Roseiconus nitratireducens]KAA5543123.1 inositol oxygenase [Roseiconus nitratireducens]